MKRPTSGAPPHDQNHAPEHEPLDWLEQDHPDTAAGGSRPVYRAPKTEHESAQRDVEEMPDPVSAAVRQVSVDALDAPAPDPKRDNAAVWLHDAVLYPIITKGPALGLAVLLGFVIVNTYLDEGRDAAIRSLAASLIPLVMFEYLARFQRDVLLKILPSSAILGVILFFGLGMAAMFTMEEVGNHTKHWPMNEVLVSAALATVLYAEKIGQGRNVLSWYYGILLGFLVYVVWQGVPIPQ